jgi:predicted nucleotidyltransferase
MLGGWQIELRMRFRGTRRMPLISRDVARAKIVDVLSSQLEVMSLHFFGKEAVGKVDKFSDFDLVVLSSDLKITQLKYLDLLNEVSPVIGRLTLVSEPNHMAEMIALRDLSPYQKIDLTILSNLDSKRKFGPFLKVFERASEAPCTVSDLLPLPAPSGIEHNLKDILFSVPRFTKCLWRNDFDMYRRWMGVTRNLFILLFEKNSNWEESHIKRELSPPQAGYLYSALDETDRNRLRSCLPLDGRLDISESFRNCIHFYVSLSNQKAQSRNSAIDQMFAKHMLNFMDNEIGDFLKEKATNTFGCTGP